ncbi:hypothetical protein P167DRAFT_543067 [Morchella conica CCBAS932]|uniref:Uncharacterized protein n=1 Tax=Morchella conica CCBAS932 TaxID=1392247 RepID=A0A3N4KX30_9PEZI|nr:hypothetical protein P167DRAFT_543067 [Morchella conica CCBAS932]
MPNSPEVSSSGMRLWHHQIDPLLYLSWPLVLFPRHKPYCASAAFEVLLPQNSVGRSPQITVTTDNLLSVLYPRPATDIVIGVLQNGQHVPGSPFLVATVPAASLIDPTRCILSAESHKPGQLSTVLLTAIDGEGHRLYTGENMVRAVSKSCGPVVRVTDRGDGTYVIEYYQPLESGGDETALEVTVEGIVSPLFKPPGATVTAVGMIQETKAEIDKPAAVLIQGLVKDGKEYKAKLAPMTVASGKTVITIVLDVAVKAEDTAGLRSGTFTVPKTVPVGEYTGKLFIFGMAPQPELPLFPVVVVEQEQLPPPEKFKVEGLPIYIGTGAAGGVVGGGTFTVAIPTSSQFKLKPDKLLVQAVKTDPETPKGLEPCFEYKIDAAVAGDKKIIVKIIPVIADHRPARSQPVVHSHLPHPVRRHYSGLHGRLRPPVDAVREHDRGKAAHALGTPRRNLPAAALHGHRPDLDDYEEGAVTALEDGAVVTRLMKGPMLPFDAVHIEMNCAGATGEVGVEIRGLVTMPTAFHGELEWPRDSRKVETSLSKGLQGAAWMVSDSGMRRSPFYLNLEYQQRGDDQHLPLNCRHFLHHDAVPPARARSDNNQISCWEDGRFVFTYKERTGGKEALFNVKWTNPARGNVVGLSHFRGLVEGLAL